MSNPEQFHYGPPPHVGWWLTKVKGQSGELWRWWNAVNWSYSVPSSSSAEDVGSDAGMHTLFNGAYIQWSHYWPENARVPRLDPTDGDWTFWFGGDQPVNDDLLVDYVLRDIGVAGRIPARALCWSNRAYPYFNIVAYRIIK